MSEEQDPQQTRTTSNPGWVHSPAIGKILESLEKSREQQRQEIQELGGTQAFLHTHAPRLLCLFTEPCTESQVLAESTLGWKAAEERLAQCAKCPAQGGTCSGTGAPAKEGLYLTLVNGTLVYEPCSKWEVFLERQRLVASGIPESMLDISLDSILKRSPSGEFPLRDAMRGWIGGVSRKNPQKSLVLTGGNPAKRTQLAVAIARQLSRPNVRLHYTFGPRLASLLRDHYADGESSDRVDPLERCESADVLVFDFLDPVPSTREPWKPWFVERVDQMLWKRLSSGMPTLMVSRARRVELWEHFEYASTIVVDELDISQPAFGPFI